MANLRIRYFAITDPADRVSSFVDSQTQIVLCPQALNTGVLQSGPQYAYYYVEETALGGQNIQSGWNHFCYQPASLTCTSDMTSNLVLIPGETDSTQGVAAYAISAPYDCHVSCRSDILPWKRW